MKLENAFKSGVKTLLGPTIKRQSEAIVMGAMHQQQQTASVCVCSIVLHALRKKKEVLETARLKSVRLVVFQPVK